MNRWTHIGRVRHLQSTSVMRQLHIQSDGWMLSETLVGAGDIQ